MVIDRLTKLELDCVREYYHSLGKGGAAAMDKLEFLEILHVSNAPPEIAIDIHRELMTLRYRKAAAPPTCEPGKRCQS